MVNCIKVFIFIQKSLRYIKLYVKQKAKGKQNQILQVSSFRSMKCHYHYLLCSYNLNMSG